MSQVSKHKLNQEVYDQIFSLFPQFLSRLTKIDKARIAIDTLFSKTERTMLAKRLAISFMLINGYTYDQIKDKIKVSSGTIGKIAEITKNADTYFIRELQRISQEEAFNKFLNSIGYKIAVALPPKGRNLSVWRRNIESDRRKSNQKI